MNPNHYDAFPIDAAYPLTPALSPKGAREKNEARQFGWDVGIIHHFGEGVMHDRNDRET